MSDDLRIKLLVVDDEQSIRRLCMTIGTPRQPGWKPIPRTWFSRT
jgi:hypothetical protein